MAAFTRHCGISPDRISDEQIRDYLVGLHQRGLRPATINAVISALRPLYLCDAQARGRVDQDRHQLPGNKTRDYEGMHKNGECMIRFE